MCVDTNWARVLLYVWSFFFSFFFVVVRGGDGNRIVLHCFSFLFAPCVVLCFVLSKYIQQQCKLAAVARDTLLTDISLDTVDMMTNFDGNEQEPVVLPSRLPVSK